MFQQMQTSRITEQDLDYLRKHTTDGTDDDWQFWVTCQGKMYDLQKVMKSQDVRQLFYEESCIIGPEDRAYFVFGSFTQNPFPYAVILLQESFAYYMHDTDWELYMVSVQNNKFIRVLCTSNQEHYSLKLSQTDVSSYIKARFNIEHWMLIVFMQSKYAPITDQDLIWTVEKNPLKHGTLIGSGMVGKIRAGASVEDLHIASGGSLIISSGGTAINPHVDFGGQLYVTNNAVVSGGGISGLTEISGKVISANFEGHTLCADSAKLSRCVLQGDGVISALDGAVIDILSVKSGGLVVFNDRTSGSDITISSGGRAKVYDNSNITNLFIWSGGVASIQKTADVSIDKDAGGEIHEL
jgi:hypothetical protein